MGSCLSTGFPTTDAVNQPPTAKVITIAGALREYSTPVATSDVLGSDSSTAFLCSSDRLYCNEYVRALEPDSLLHPGQIYFVLPAAKLRLPLSAEDMAALTVKASLALGMLSERDGRRNKKIKMMPPPDMEDDWEGSSSRKPRERGDLMRRPAQVRRKLLLRVR